ncbi:MAG: AI-2E family transporter [Acetobacteraceae bacterium]
MTLSVGVVVISGLYLAREVLIPITLAVLLSFVLAPLVALLRRVGLSRSLSVISAALLALSVVVMLGGVIGSQLAQLANDVPRYATTIEKKVSVVRGFTLEQVSGLMKKVGKIEPTQAAPGKATAPAPDPSAPRAPIPVEVHQPEPTPLQLLQQVVTPVLGPIATMGIVFVVAIFVLMQREDLRDRLIRLFGSSDLHRTTAALDDAAARLSRYFLTQLALNASFGVVIGVGLFLIGVPNPVLWGIVAAMMRFVPYIGSIGSAVFPVTLAAAVDPGWTMVLLTLGLFLVIEPLVSQLVEPLVYSHSTGLSPVSVVISAIFWGWLWGAVGLILSMPLTLLLVVMGRHVDRLEFIDVLLGDQPALTPAESLYQRMLAGDADEALDQAEILLRDRPLSAYYDEVAVPGLQLAANDSLRGVLTADQLRQILDAISGVIVDLSDHPDGTVPDDLGSKWTGESAVLCVSGRGPLDEAVCSMLAQVLGKRGLRSRVVSSEAVARNQIASLDVEGVQLICISYIEGGNTLSALRYLTRRLRQRAPGAALMVGLWQGDPTLLTDDRIRTAVGADLYVNSLRDALDACLAAARQGAEQPELAA